MSCERALCMDHGPYPIVTAVTDRIDAARSMHMKGIFDRFGHYTTDDVLIMFQKGIYTKDHHGHDPGQRCVSAFPGRPQEHCDK